MTPKYPTTARFRRHRTPPATPLRWRQGAVVALGVVLASAGGWAAQTVWRQLFAPVAAPVEPVAAARSGGAMAALPAPTPAPRHTPAKAAPAAPVVKTVPAPIKSASVAPVKPVALAAAKVSPVSSATTSLLTQLGLFSPGSAKMMDPQAEGKSGGVRQTEGGDPAQLADGPVAGDLTEMASATVEEPVVEEGARDKVDLTFFQNLREQRVILPGDRHPLPPRPAASTVVHLDGGKAAVRPANTTTTPVSSATRPVTPPPATAPAAAPKPANPTAFTPAAPQPVTVQAAKAPVPQPVVQTPPTKGSPVAQPFAGAPARENYVVQLAELTDFAAASALASRLEGSGSSAAIHSVLRNGQRVYQLRVGPFHDAQSATAAGQRLRVAGQPTLVVRSTK